MTNGPPLEQAVSASGSQLRARVVRAFQLRFSASPTWVTHAPGRVNLIGEHTDYNDGFVLPMAINRNSWFAVRARSDRMVRVHSLDFDEEREFSLDDSSCSSKSWMKYLHALALSLQGSGAKLTGWEGVTAGDVPIGAGLSSSAALELAAARAFACAAGLPWQPSQMALLAQHAENTYVGVNCGIMDQMISASGQAGHALLIDCRTLDTRAVAMPTQIAVVILDSATRRGLVESAYNERRAACEEAAHVLGVPALRDVSEADFAARAHELEPGVRKRARHVVSENARTLRAVTALEANDSTTLGRLMNESHESLRDDFEVSRAELNIIVELARKQPGCHGARLTGAGFGGCAVALVDADSAPAFADDVSLAYRQATGLKPALYVSKAAGGASAEAVTPLT